MLLINILCGQASVMFCFIVALQIISYRIYDVILVIFLITFVIKEKIAAK